jgi:integrase
VFASDASTPLDESNVRKAFNRILDTAELPRRGPYQMRHTFASLLLGRGRTPLSQGIGVGRRARKAAQKLTA